MHDLANQSGLSNVWGRLNRSPIIRGEGTYVFDNEGNRFIDFTSGIGVTATGHCHHEVVEAIRSQAGKLVFGQMNCMLPEITTEYAQALRTFTPDSIDTFFFSNSGAEAVEGAIKLAKVATGRTNIIAFEGGFHGRTALTMALTTSKTIFRSGYQPLPSGIFVAPYPNAYRYGWDDDQTVDFCLSQLDQLLHTQTAPDETAAMIIEPVLGEGGFIPAPPRFLDGLRKICDETGILLIVDEIQSGFGRTGKNWAHQASTVRPDIMTMAKGIASGLPMSAIGASRKLMDEWKPGSHGGTYGGGSAIAIAAAIATLKVIENEGLVENAERMGAYLTERLRAVVADRPGATQVRGPGLMIGVEFSTDGQPDSKLVARIQKESLRQGLMLLGCGPDGNVIRWLPPLNVAKSEIDAAVTIFSESLR